MCDMPSRYGAGELYGFDFSTLSPERIRELSLASHRDVGCPFKPPEPGKSLRRCNKKGGVCSLQLFAQDAQGRVECKADPVITCPNPFLEGDLVVRWVSDTLIGTPNPVVMSELPFLMDEIQAEEAAEPDAVEKIDQGAAHPEGERLKWLRN